MTVESSASSVKPAESGAPTNQLGTAPSAQPAPGPAPAAAARILIAEDNVLNQKVMVHLLRTVGQVADVAANGVLAVDAVARQHYDLVLMDVRMPEMDGLEATRRIRALPGASKLHIYALTAGVAPDERQACLDAGMEGFLSKPVQRDELIALLQQIGLG